jgi:predicted metal-dependent hydrolase
MPTLELGDITLDLVRKDIKNVHLSVYPPSGRVRIAAPTRMSDESIRLFAISKLSWIRQHQRTLREQDRDTPREYLDRESHYVWGRRLLLKLAEAEAAPAVTLSHSRLILTLRPGSDEAKRHEALAGWYRELVRAEVPDLIACWEPKMQVKVAGYYVQHMKTRWGSCNPVARTIRLNTELAKKPRQCLEYIVVHEMTHLLEPTHNGRFLGLMDRFMPHWREVRDLLNRLPARHERWQY